MIDTPEPTYLTLLRGGQKTTPSTPRQAGPPAAEGDVHARLRQLADELAHCPDGEGTVTANRLAFFAGQYVGAGQVDERTAVSYLLDGVAGWTWRRPGDHLGVARQIEKGVADGARQPRAWEASRAAVDDEAVADWLAHVAVTQAQAVQGDGEPDAPDIDDLIERALPILDWHALWADDDTEEWIVEPLLPARRLVALYSPPKVGKSLLMLEIAVGVARGTEVLGVVPDRPRRVLYVDFENDPRGDVRERLQAMGREPDDLTNLCYLSFPVLAGLDSPAGSAALMAAVEHYTCEVVVIDTVSRAVAGEENDNDTWLQFYRHTGLAMKQAGVSMIRLDHTGKDEAKGQRGGSAKVGDVDAVWKLERRTEDTFRLTCEANRMPVPEKEIVLTRLSEPVLRHKVEGGGWMAEAEAVEAALVAAMDAAGLPDDAGRDQARAVAKAAKIRASNERLSAAVRRRKSCPRTVRDLSASPRTGALNGPDGDLSRTGRGQVGGDDE